MLANKSFNIKKPWSEMTESERKIRIRQLWLKIKMFVRLRKSFDSLKGDIEMKEFEEVFNQALSDEEDGLSNYDSADE